MGNATKIWLIVAAALVALGLITFLAAMTVNHWDFAKLSTVEYETNTYQVSEEFSNVSIKAETANILFAPSDEGKCKVVCYEQQKIKHSVTVEEKTLTVNTIDTRKWYDHIAIFSMATPRITVYLPKSEYASLLINVSTGDTEIPTDLRFESIDVSASTGGVNCYASASDVIKIKTTTGDICVKNVSAGSLDLTVSTGKVTASAINCQGDVKINVTTGKTSLTDIVCKGVTSSGSTGNITLENVIATQKLSISRSTGDVKFDGSDATEIYVKTDTGDVTGSLLTDKVFITQTDTGRIDVPKTITGGKCEINTDTGNIHIIIEDQH